jgi:copper chaperone CopZ
MKSEFFIENVKCYGCRNTAIKEAKKQDLVTDVDIDIETGKVSLHYDGSKETLARVKSRLHRKGYPEKGKNNMLSSVKSYASCAMGRWGSSSNKKEIQRIQTLKL